MDKSVVLLIFGGLAAIGTLVSVTGQPEPEARVLSHAPQVQASRLSASTDSVALTRKLRMKTTEDHRGFVTSRGSGSSKFITLNARN